MLTAQSLTFRVEGTARPQGSMHAFAYRKKVTRTLGARIVSDSPHLAEWRQAVAAAARAMIPTGRTTYAGAVDVAATFALHRPQRGAGTLPTTRPDVDKLARAILDALTGIVWVDDAQVVALHVAKRYTRTGEQPHAAIIVSPAGAQGPRLFEDAHVD
jgi:crossover junction endodeoxyribonuclease RusA